MPIYRYRAVSESGQVRTGRTEALNLPDLEARLKQVQLELIEAGASATASMFAAWGGAAKPKDLITFCLHLAQVTRAGISVLDGLKDLIDEVEHPRFRAILGAIVEAIQSGTGLADALAAYPKLFDQTFVALVRAGEHSGNIPDTFQKLADALKWGDELRAGLKKLLMYPMFGLTVITGVFLFLMIYLVPQLSGFIRSMSGGQLPLQTKILLGISGFLVHQWWVLLVVPAAIGITVLLVLRYASEGLRTDLDGLKLRLPLVGSTLKKIALARFAATLGMLYASSVPVLAALDLAAGAAGNRVITKAVLECKARIAEGLTIAESFEQAKLFPRLVLRMLRIGEITGELDRSLANVGYFYDREIAESIESLQAIIEPVLTVFMGSILGWLILSMLGPLYDTISKLKT
ncbi:MAG TPA: type II secretion system F family protein [Steroidobacteraceae bacterium]|nr:type II secretion system F family protein [Steroidobacteraceae bacterium]